LEGLNPVSNEIYLQNRENRKRIEEESRLQLSRDEAALLKTAVTDMAASWGNDIFPLIDANSKSRSIMKRFKYNQGILSSVIFQKKSRVERVRVFKEWPKILDLIETIFHTKRTAKSFYLELIKDYDPKIIEKAYKELDKNSILGFWNTANHVGLYEYEFGQGFLEVRYAAQDACGFGGDDAEELVNQDERLKKLVEYAENTPSVELVK